MKLFRNVVYASSIDDCDEAYQNLMTSSITQKYKNCLTYFEELYEISSFWAKCHRKDQLLRGIDTNNYVEAQFLVIKDTILQRQRQYNINQLLDKLVPEFEDHFKQRLRFGDKQTDK